MNDITALLPHIKLRFNMDHPSYEESYCLGYQCAADELAEEENPFAPGTQAAEQWLEGWWDAYAGAEPLFDVSYYLEETESEVAPERVAANKNYYYPRQSWVSWALEISGAVAASAVIGYQLFDMVA